MDLTGFVIAIAAFLIGLGKGGLGGMVGALVTAIVALVLPPIQVVGLVLPLLIVGDLFGVVAHWGRWDGAILRRLVPASIVGVLLATYALSRLSGEGLRLVLGIIVLLFVFLKLTEGIMLERVRYDPKLQHGWFAGVVAGIFSTLAHGGGPPVSMYLVLQPLTPEAFAATAAFFFFVLNWVKVPSYWAAGLFDCNLLRQALWVLPLVPLGVLLGKWGVTRIGRPIFKKIVLVLLGLSGVLLLVR